MGSAIAVAENRRGRRRSVPLPLGAEHLEPRRLLKRKEAIGDYLKRVRSQHTAAIKITEEFKPKAAASGSATPNAPPPGLPMPE